jgi:hypothetical protein
MEAVDVLRELAGVADAPAAARILATRIRAQVAEPLFAADADQFLPYSTPVSLELLREIGRACGIQRVEFGATLTSEGELEPRNEGGFTARILRKSHTNRARFTLAHEIAHTFFYDKKLKPPMRLCFYSRDDAYRPKRHFRDDVCRPESHCSAALEEWFCNEFAFELLLPENAGTQLMAEVTKELSPSETLYAIERIHRAYRTSIQTVLQRLAQADGIAPDLLIVVLRKMSHVKTKQDVAVRVTTFFPRPARNWFLPPNRRASSIGLRGAEALFDWWGGFPNRQSEKEYKRRSGVFSIDEVQGNFVVYENESMPRGDCRERIVVDARSSVESPWKKIEVAVPVPYRFYAVNVVEAYCLALIDFSGVSQEIRESLPVVPMKMAE